MDKKQYVDKVLRFLLTKEGRYYIKSSEFMTEILTNEHFVIFYYMLEMDRSNVILSKELLELGLATNKMDWVNVRSKLMRDNEEITREYLQSKTSVRLEYPEDYANALEILVQTTFNSLMNTEVPSEQEFLAIMENIREVSSTTLAMKVMKEVLPVIQGDRPFIYYNNIRYDKSDVLQYMSLRTQDLLYGMAPSNNILDNKYHIWNKLSQNSVELIPNVIWNLGKNVFTNPSPGFIISIVAPPKVGKTRFCVGEIAYPALLMGKNVKYYSGEMEEYIVRAMLITKHIKFMLGRKIKEDTVRKVMITASRIRTKRATKQELEYFEKVPANIKEYTLLAENDLFYNEDKKYGKLKVVHVGDVDSTDIGAVSGDFIVEQQHVMLRKEIEQSAPEDRWDIVVQDHVNHMRSERGLKDAAMMESYVQSAKALATSTGHKLTYVLVNHLNTEQEKTIRENDSAEGLELRGHGTNEGRKSADIELIMYQTSQDKKEGKVRVQCTADRYTNIEEKFKTNEFVFVADRGYCDFTFEGSNVKPPYPTVDQLEQIEEAIMSMH